jgi:EAL domain-containing protein (putative c-di-GMP-specific phosphodiesterase class I)
MTLLSTPRSRSACRDGITLFPFSMAFQPIVDTTNATVFAYEALCRGPQGESAFSVLSQVTDENRYAFDQACRVKAITLASQLGLVQTGAHLSINFMPNAIYSPAACLRLTLNTARQLQFPPELLIFEFTEQEKIINFEHLRSIVTEYKRQGFQVALDDFGAGWSGLTCLSEFAPDILKLDMELTRNLHRRPAAIQIVRHLASLAHSIGCRIIAEGVETVEEYNVVRDCGVHLMQGYLLARPSFEALPPVTLPAQVPTPIPAPIERDLCYTKDSSLEQESTHVYSSHHAETGR